MGDQAAVIVRCSDLDSLHACAPSVLDTEGVRINPSNDAAALGSAVHELAARYIETGDYDTAAACHHHGLPPGSEETVAGLMGYAARAWDELRKYFPAPKTEVIVAGDEFPAGGRRYQIRGTSDVLSAIGERQAIFLDWKSGYIDEGYQHQMAGYAHSIWCVLGRPRDTTITGVICFLRHRYYRIVKYDAARLEAWEYDLMHNVLSKPGEFRPGPQCRHCSLYAACDARKAVVEATLDVMLFRNSTGQHDAYQKFLDDARDLMAGLTEYSKGDQTVAETVGTLLFRARMAQRAVDDVRDLLRTTLQRVGPIRLDDSTALTLREVEIKELEPAKAMRVLRQHLSDSQICEAMKLSLPKLLDAYGKGRAHKRGDMRAARLQLEEELVRQGVVASRHQQRMEEVDISKVQVEPEPGQPEQPEPAQAGDASTDDGA